MSKEEIFKLEKVKKFLKYMEGEWRLMRIRCFELYTEGKNLEREASKKYAGCYNLRMVMKEIREGLKELGMPVEKYLFAEVTKKDLETHERKRMK